MSTTETALFIVKAQIRYKTSSIENELEEIAKCTERIEDATKRMADAVRVREELRALLPIEDEDYAAPAAPAAAPAEPEAPAPAPLTVVKEVAK